MDSFYEIMSLCMKYNYLERHSEIARQTHLSETWLAKTIFMIFVATENEKS